MRFPTFAPLPDHFEQLAAGFGVYGGSGPEGVVIFGDSNLARNVLIPFMNCAESE
jgi:hypothetical protein